MSVVCAFEAKMALFHAALRASIARDEHDEVALALWRRCADEARQWLRDAYNDGEQREECVHAA